MSKFISTRLFANSFTAALLLCAPYLSADAQIDMTPRQRLLNNIQQQSPAPETAPKEDENTKGAAQIQTGVSDPAEDILAEDTLIDQDIIATSPTTIIGAAASEPKTPELIAASPPPLPPSSGVSKEDLTAPPAQAGPKRLGFFTSARDYLVQRGETQGPRLTLRYAVTRKNAVTAVPGQSSTVDIIIGKDYAAISKSKDELVIYDFKEKRLLNVSAANNIFTNASLYAAAYRSLDTVGKMTDDGKKRTLSLGPDLTLDAFYLESALGYAAGPPPDDLKVTQTKDKITAELGSKRVFSATLDGPKLDDYRQAYSFISLLYHSEPVHPAILAELADVRTAPNSITFYNIGPKIPQGEIISWTLKSKMAETSDFPLPATAKSVIELENVSPLNYVMAEAIAGRALGGRAAPSAALSVVKQQVLAGELLSAWVSAQTLQDSLGGCESLKGFCKIISEIETQKNSNQELNALMTSLSLTQETSNRAKGLLELKPMLTAASAPSFVLRRAGLALAKVPSAEREAKGLSDLDPADLLSQAIARYPYDFIAYQGLARLYAARGDFILSWDINDALRAFPDAPDKLRAPIDRAESQLIERVPGFFPPVDG